MTPSKIKLHKQSQILELHFPAEGGEPEAFKLNAEFLRVHSPSAEVKGHGPGQEVLQFGKKEVAIKAIEAVGNYAIKLTFDDGHDSGIYSWSYLHELGLNEEKYWNQYLDELHKAEKSRAADTNVVKLML